MPFTAAAVAAALASFVLETCPVCAPERPCDTHAALERRVIDETREGLASKDEKARTEAVMKIGALHDAMANSPSRAATEALAASLGDPSADVRLAAAMAFARAPQAPALAELLRALDRERPKIVDPEYDAIDTAQGLARVLDPKAPKPSEAERRKHKEVAMSRLICSTLVDALGGIPDDRATAAVIRHLLFSQDKTIDTSFGPTRCVEALFRLGSRSGVDAAVAALEREERVTKASAASRKNLRRSLAAALARGAAARGFEDTPPPATGTGAEWRSWFGKHRGEFPAKLGTLAPPPRDTPAAPK